MADQRVTFTVTELGPGGAETQIFRVSKELQLRGVNCQIISLKKPLGYVEELEQCGVQVASLNMTRASSPVKGLSRCAALIADFSPTVLVNVLFHANLIGVLAGVGCDVPRVFTSLRGLDPKSWRDKVERELLRTGFSGGLITNSQVLAQEFIRRGIAVPSDLYIIPNGIEISNSFMGAASRLSKRTELGLFPDEFVWLAVANILPIKDIPTMLKAFKEVRAVRQNVRLLIAGARWDKRHFSMLERLQQSLGLGDCVEFLGGRDDVRRLIGACDGFVMTSLSEGTPNAMIEAMAGGLPVVSTAAGGVLDLIQDNVNGLLASVGQSRDVGAQMLRLMDMSESDRRQLADRALEVVVSRHTLSAVVDRWEAVLFD